MGAIPVTLPAPPANRPLLVTTFDCVTLPELVSTIFRQRLTAFVQSMDPTNNCAFAPIWMGPWIPSEIWTEVVTVMVVVLTNVSCPQLGEMLLMVQLFPGATGVPAT